MKIYEVYTYTDPHRGWGYGDLVTVVTANSREEARELVGSKQRDPKSFWYDHGIVEVPLENAHDMVESIYNNMNRYTRLYEEIRKAVEEAT